MFDRRTILKAIAASPSLITPASFSEGARPFLTRTIRRTTEELPVVGLGTWQVFDVSGQDKALKQAQETLQAFATEGGRVIDSSPMYGSAEEVVGDLTSRLQPRSKLFIATKVWTSGREAGIQQMEASMRKLRLDRCDLMQVHNLVDADTHLGTLREWKEAGRIRYLGLTHYTAAAYPQMERYIEGASPDFVQVNYSLAEREAERRILPRAAEAQIAILINRPFAEGALFRKVKDKPLPPWAKEFDCASWAQYFLKWIIAHPAVTCVIPGTRNPAHVIDNLQAAKGRLPDQTLRKKMAEYFDRI